MTGLKSRSVRLLGRCLFLALVSLLTLPADVATNPWPEFRGPTGQGHSTAANLPLTWSESENKVWKAAIPGRGWSSPAVGKEQIWLTAAIDQGQGKSLRAIAVDPGSGRLLHNVEVFQIDHAPAVHEKNGYASPTPILEGDRVYVHFGTLGTAALSVRGEILWKTQELRYAHAHGPGGSPALSGDLLVISCDGTDQQYVVALDKNSGKIRWKTAREGSAMAFTTPLVIQAGGLDQVISAGGNRAGAYQLDSGEMLWWIEYEGFSLVPRPVFGHGLVYIMSGYHRPALFAVRPDGRGNVTTTHVAWKHERGVSLTASPLLIGEDLYMVSDNGIATCLNAKTGEERWRARLGGEFSASPVYADGRIYFLNETGTSVVIRPGSEFKKLAENQVDGRTLASLATADGAIFLRTAHTFTVLRI